MRTFLALALPNQEMEQLEAWSRRLQLQCDAKSSEIRWVRGTSFHLTLRFFGEIDEAQYQAIVSCVSDVVATFAPIPVRAGSLGVFPNWRQPRVLWAGMEPKDPTLHQLFQELDQALDAAGLGQHDKLAFHPHITLARIRSSPPHLLSKQLSSEQGKVWGQDFVMSTLILFCSELSPSGAVYTPLHQWPLGDGVVE